MLQSYDTTLKMACFTPDERQFQQGAQPLPRRSAREPSRCFTFPRQSGLPSGAAQEHPILATNIAGLGWVSAAGFFSRVRAYAIRRESSARAVAHTDQVHDAHRTGALMLGGSPRQRPFVGRLAQALPT